MLLDVKRKLLKPGPRQNLWNNFGLHYDFEIHWDNVRWKLDWNLQVKMQRDVRREALKPGTQPRWALLSQWQTLLPAAWAQILELPFLLGNTILVVTVGFLGLVFIGQPNLPTHPSPPKREKF